MRFGAVGGRRELVHADMPLPLGKGERFGLLAGGRLAEPIFPGKGGGAHRARFGEVAVIGVDGQRGRAGALLRGHCATSAAVEVIESAMRFMPSGIAPCRPSEGKRTHVVAESDSAIRIPGADINDSVNLELYRRMEGDNPRVIRAEARQY